MNYANARSLLFATTADNLFDALDGIKSWDENEKKWTPNPKVSTNVYLHRMHNFALDMNWLGGPIIPKPQWPKPEYKKKRAIKLEEHLAIVGRETNPERKAFYRLARHTGAANLITDLNHPASDRCCMNYQNLRR